ncbi:conserved hypothetical protein [Sulfolobus islandicus Y.N.15.51]|uniref:Uncharacterized protein n=2 Tax=Saccharolobus islandicus TaxID=43080 RepID=C3NKA7_SACI1|nr:conserved hypothetical protein [Sulfolobus islandicus Y.N.15.51]
MSIKYIINFNPKRFKMRSYDMPNKIEEDKIVNYLWYLKTLLRCLLKLKNLQERYVLGSGKSSIPYISRISLNINQNKLIVICLLEDDSTCDLIFKVIEDEFIRNNKLTDMISGDEIIRKCAK